MTVKLLHLYSQEALAREKLRVMLLPLVATEIDNLVDEAAQIIGRPTFVSWVWILGGMIFLLPSPFKELNSVRKEREIEQTVKQVISDPDYRPDVTEWDRKLAVGGDCSHISFSGRSKDLKFNTMQSLADHIRLSDTSRGLLKKEMKKSADLRPLKISRDLILKRYQKRKRRENSEAIVEINGVKKRRIDLNREEKVLVRRKRKRKFFKVIRAALLPEEIDDNLHAERHDRLLLQSAQDKNIYASRKR